ncbi:MAG: aldehyde dehydrogenase [Myxococcales bacterium]|nr:aldehyde dehydrogenase [Myxococcales bacterium]
MASPQFAESAATFPPTPIGEVDAAVARVYEAKDRWISVSPERRAKLLNQCMAGVRAVASQWANATNDNRGLTGEAGAEPWLSEVWPTLRCMRLLRDTMAAGCQPKLPGLKSRADGQMIAQVMPVDAFDKVVFGGITGEIWLEPGKPATQGELYRNKARGERPKGTVGLVLGAGNVGSIGPTDALHKLFVEDQVVVLKTNPVNAYLGPMWEASLRPLIDEGFCAVLHGGVEVGIHLCQHPQVDEIHVTGSDKTHDAIVYGVGEQGRKNKEKDERVNPRPVASELGCVTPVLVVPGPWSDADIRYHARNVASAVANNASFNCLAAKAIVTARGWPLRERFLTAVHEALAELPRRKAYYPGAEGRWQQFCEAYPNHVKLGDDAAGAPDGSLPWTILPDVQPTAAEYALSNEAFCGVLAEVTLECDDAPSFLTEATRFANEEAWGNLSCFVICDKKTQQVHAEAFDRAIADLRYGGISINVFPGLIFGFMSTTWGAYPGNPDNDIRSGKGVVHNTFLLDYPQKSVVRAPFRIFPLPPWFEGHRQALGVAKRMVTLQTKRSWRLMPGIISHAVRG